MSAAPTGTRAPRGGAGRSRPGAGRLDPDQLAALEEERDFLLRSLEDLERERAAGDVDEADHRALVDDYTARAAAVIAAIEQRRTTLARSSPPRPRGRLAAVVAVVALAAVGVGWWVAASADGRGSADGLTGDVRATSIDEISRANELTAQANEAVQAGRSDEAVRLYQEGIAAYDRALELQPGNTQALTYRGWLLFNIARRAPTPESAAQLDALALEWIERALAADPDYPDARIFRAILLQEADPVAALADLDAVPQQRVPVLMRDLVGSLRTRVEAAAAIAAGSPADPAGPPADPAGEQPAGGQPADGGS